jgi:hypothetical protein
LIAQPEKKERERERQAFHTWIRALDSPGTQKTTNQKYTQLRADRE